MMLPLKLDPPSDVIFANLACRSWRGKVMLHDAITPLPHIKLSPTPGPTVLTSFLSHSFNDDFYLIFAMAAVSVCSSSPRRSPKTKNRSGADGCFQTA